MLVVTMIHVSVSIDVPPSLAYSCLRSVPVDVERDIAIIEYIRPWLKFQSTIMLLKSPPEGYLTPGVDILGELERMTKDLHSGGYKSQYEFVLDLFDVISIRPRDSHLFYQPELLKVFKFASPLELESISTDGLNPPEVYIYGEHSPSSCFTVTNHTTRRFKSGFEAGLHSLGCRLNQLQTRNRRHLPIVLGPDALP
jgi:hypothetical protein